MLNKVDIIISLCSRHSDQESLPVFCLPVLNEELPSLDQSTTSIMGSEPNIYNTKLSHNQEAPHSSMKSHNSDSEIVRLTTERRDDGDTGKVLFTLGDDTSLTSEILVKISSNNADEYYPNMNDKVKRICSEIKDFCSDKEEEGFDVVKHLEAINVNIDIAKYMEERKKSVVDCENSECENCSDLCDVSCANNVTDVIVIPSAEAILDTGRGEASLDIVDNIQ